MKVSYKAKNTTLSPALRKYLETKIVSPAEKLLKRDEAALLDVEFARVTGRRSKGDVWLAEATLSLGRKLMRAEEQGEDPHEVIDIVGAELIREIKTYKTKSQTTQIRGGRSIKRILKKPL